MSKKMSKKTPTTTSPSDDGAKVAEPRVPRPSIGRVVIITTNDGRPLSAGLEQQAPAIVQTVHDDGTINVSVLSDLHEKAAPSNVRNVPHADVALAEGSNHRGLMWSWPARV